MNNMRIYKKSNNPKYIYQLSTSKYQAYKDVNNMHARYKHKWVKRERDKQSQTRENYFEIRVTCSMSPPSLQYRIFTKNNPARSLDATTPTTSFLENSTDLQVPHLFPQEQYTMWTRKFAEAATSNPSKYKEEHLLITSLDHQQILSQIRIL